MYRRINVATSILMRNQAEDREDPAIVVTTLEAGREILSQRCSGVVIKGPSRVVQLKGLRVFIETEAPVDLTDATPYRIDT